ncbi:LacI family DNA-binding transcriptional regulator [Glaciecola sp. 2405UD65-10]|uniref:LacI family DNA-binding transcriptional regulator n=1 Tax=Glaciecola sp. 2405UD65-10 TaxID=3397244 RepID=UPI003B5B0753
MTVPNKRNLTLKDVALKLGTSTATISNAFNRPDQLSAKKRKFILEACEELGFSGPNKAAQILRKGKSNIIALVLADSIDYMVTDPVANSFIEGVSKVLKEEGKHLLLYSGDSSTLTDVEDFVDGFICYGAPRNNELLANIQAQRKPVVTVDFNLVNRPSVNIDNETSAYEVASLAVKPTDTVAIIGLRLIEANTTCRIYDSPLLDLEKCITRRRLNGFTKAIEETGNSVQNDMIWHIPENNHKYAKQAALEVLSAHPRPNVVLCMSDLVAIEVLYCATAANIKVPEELRITGFDGINEALRVSPSISTVCQASVQKGVSAATMLLSGVKESVVLPCEIKTGETAAIDD